MSFLGRSAELVSPKEWRRLGKHLLALNLAIGVSSYLVLTYGDVGDRVAEEITGQQMASLGALLSALIGCVLFLATRLVLAWFAPPGDERLIGALVRQRLRHLEREWEATRKAERKVWEQEREDWKLEQTARLYRQVMDQKFRGLLQDDSGDEDRDG